MSGFLDTLKNYGLESWRGAFADLLHERQRYLEQVDKKSRRYLDLLPRLPEAQPSCLALDSGRVTIGASADLDASRHAELMGVLKELRPWRKGPFSLFGIEIDSEWRSSLKWDRLKEHITPLAGRRILDIGSSNGYYLFRMAGSAPSLALGVEPYLTNYYQFLVLQHYARVPNLFTLPVKFEELPDLHGVFDTVFAMGILYHRRSPIDALAEMARVMRRGAELVLETLVIGGEEPLALCPQKRYAKMNNVYFLPTVSCLCQWLERAGFIEVRCLDVSRTTSQEQSGGEWVGTQSLVDFLDPDDPLRTIEGYPPPTRALLTAVLR